MSATDRSYTILQLALMDETGDSFYRMRWPAAELARLAPNWRVINLDSRAEERYRWALEADLLIVYQSADVDLLPILKKRRSLGKKTLVEYNDNFYAPPAASPVAREWSSPLLWQTYELFMEASDGVIVTGFGLERLFGSRIAGKPIYILENHFPRPPDSLYDLEKGKGRGLAFGWAGSLGHISDFLAIVPTLKEILREFPESRLHVMGNESIPELLRIPADRLSFTHWGSIHQYYDFWRPVQIGVAPLLETPYNECRSDIKAVEMGALAVAPVLTQALPYQSFCEKTAVPRYRTSTELSDLLRKLLNDTAQARCVASRCYQYVASERVGPMRTERLAVYSKYLPSEPGAFSGPSALGYQEIQGTSSKTPPITRSLQEIQALLKAGNSNDALLRLQSGISENPFAPDLALALARVLLSRKDPGALAVLTQSIAKFPRDLRFRLLYAGAAGDSSARRKAWFELIGVAEQLDPRSRRFFRKDLVDHAVQLLKVDPGTVEVGEALLKIYPEALALRFSVGELQEAAGRYGEAKGHFDLLKTAAELKGLNEQFLAGMEEGYVQAWYEALKAR